MRAVILEDTGTRPAISLEVPHHQEIIISTAACSDAIPHQPQLHLHIFPRVPVVK